MRNASAAELVASALVSTAVFIYRRGEEISIRYEFVIRCSTITSAIIICSEEAKTFPILRTLVRRSCVYAVTPSRGYKMAICN